MAFLFGRNKRKDKRNEESSNTSNTPTTTATTTTTIQDNIVRIQTFNHVSDKYDIIELIGKGSMGAIYKVRIKPNKLGGSAFYPKKVSENDDASNSTTTQQQQQQQQQQQEKNSFIGRFKKRGWSKGGTQNSNLSSTALPSPMPSVTTTTTINNPVVVVAAPPPSLPEFNQIDDINIALNNRHVYALKTIRLDTINDMVDDTMIHAFLDELMNEMNILRTLDHPNIIKAHEIFMTKPPISTTVVTKATTTTTTNLPQKMNSNESEEQEDNNNNNNNNDHTTTTNTNTNTIISNELLLHQHMCIALELCNGGNLYSRAPYTIHQASYMIEQILNAARYMHDRGIVHRDLKFENILFINGNNNDDQNDLSLYDIKILDFGLSKQFKHNRIGYMYDRVGTIYTMAPEVVMDDEDIPYTVQAEVWSIGIITYMLLSKNNKKPFDDPDFYKMIDLIQDGRVNYNPPIWDTTNTTATDFVKHLLHINPYQRYTILQSIQHPFISQRNNVSNEKNTSSLPPYIYKNIESSIQQYTQKDTTMLKKLALSIIAHDSTTNKKYNTSTTTNTTASTTTGSHDNSNNNDHHNHNTIDQLQKAFALFDTEKNGILSYNEFKDAILQTISSQDSDDEEGVEEVQDSKILLKLSDHDDDNNKDKSTTTCPKKKPSSTKHRKSNSIPYTEQELERIFASLDINQNGMIMYTEFLAATIEACGRIEDDRLAEAFDRLDCDDTGYISEDNLRELLGSKSSDAEIKAIIAASDKDQDGKISYSDFLHAFRKNEVVVSDSNNNSSTKEEA